MPPKKNEEAPIPRFGRVHNNLKMGIVGLPNVGKSSLFNLLGEEAHAKAENFPFCTIDPNEARCAVPDERYDFLCDIWKPPSTHPAYLHLTDIAGLIKGASTGLGLGNAFLSHIQAVDGIFHMVRAFDNPEVLHVDDTIDPVRDLGCITAELCLKDLAYVAKQRADREADVKKSPNMKLPPLFFSVMDKCTELLESNQPLGKAEWTAAEVDKINELIPGCITLKPMVYLLNLTKKDYYKGGNKYCLNIKEWVDSHGGGLLIPVSVEFEEELKSAEKAGDTAAVEALLEPLKAKSRGSALPKIVKCGYSELALIYYFTCGEKEVRCWTVQRGATAPQAAGVIHSDFERCFIKAETVAFEDFKEHADGKSMAGVKSAGKYRQEGKTYIVQHGDIIHFQHNVTAKKK
ncbi:unnamed protein product [Polarella glacialis]|uniref:Obg-like ATPase homolog n=1 Tax=Polarella glacialis TaxID=89957 RepID=A0A813KS29_POLGL|nr:unnamed protein product [Polarella glacialis]